MTMINNQTNELTIEWAPFEVIQDVTDEQLLKAAKTLESEFLQKQDGYSTGIIELLSHRKKI